LPVSFKRFVDNTVKAVDEELVLGLSKGLQEALMSGLKVDSPDAHENCAKLIAEQPQITEKRKDLVANKEQYLSALEKLYKLLNTLVTVTSA
jgi:Dynamin GTPase effector domain